MTVFNACKNATNYCAFQFLINNRIFANKNRVRCKGYKKGDK